MYHFVDECPIQKKGGIYVAILVYSIVEHNGKLMLSLYIPMALDEASVQVPDAFILKVFGSNKRPIEMYLSHCGTKMPSHQIHLEHLKLVFLLKTARGFSDFLRKNPLKMVRKQTGSTYIRGLAFLHIY